MKNNFHPTSIVSIKANIDPSSIIGPNCLVGENVKIGKNCKLISNVVIDGNTTIGDGCEFYPFSVIGMVPQDLKYKGEKTFLKIGNQNIFREHSTIHLGTESGGGTTIIGNNNLIMTGTHVAHDCKIGNNIVLSHHVALAGHVEINDNAILSAMVGVVQFRRIGSYSMIGGLCAVDMDVSPFTIASGIDGSRAYINGVNIIGMKRKGFSKEEINCASETLKSFFNDTDTYQNRLQKLQLISSNKVNNIIKDFLLKETKNGICHPKSLL